MVIILEQTHKQTKRSDNQNFASLTRFQKFKALTIFFINFFAFQQKTVFLIQIRDGKYQLVIRTCKIKSIYIFKCQKNSRPLIQPFFTKLVIS